MRGDDRIDAEEIVLGGPATQGVIVRLAMVSGPRNGQHRAFDDVKRIDAGRPASILVESQAQMRWGRPFVENVDAAMVQTATTPRMPGLAGTGRVSNVADPEQPPEADVIRELGELAGRHGEVAVSPDANFSPHLAPGATLDHLPSIGSDGIRIALDCAEPVPRHSALSRANAWERGHAPAEVPAEQFDYAAEDVILPGH